MKKNSKILWVRYLSIACSLFFFEILFGHIESALSVVIGSSAQVSPVAILFVFMSFNILVIPLAILTAENVALKLIKHSL